MFAILRARLQQKYRTSSWPEGPAPALPARFAGRPRLHPSACDTCGRCAAVCPTQAIACKPGLTLDTGRCIFCRACEQACPHQSIVFGADYRLSAAARDALIICDTSERPPPALVEKARAYFGRSLKLRQVSAGGCGACEADANVLGTPVWDMGRFGIKFVASPRHADGLLITGPVSGNMRLALEKTYAAVPTPKIVIACGACAISGGIYAGHPETRDGAASVVPVDLFVPGCPPHPLTLLDGLLRFIGRQPDPG